MNTIWIVVAGGALSGVVGGLAFVKGAYASGLARGAWAGYLRGYRDGKADERERSEREISQFLPVLREMEGFQP